MQSTPDPRFQPTLQAAELIDHVGVNARMESREDLKTLGYYRARSVMNWFSGLSDPSAISRASTDSTRWYLVHLRSTEGRVGMWRGGVRSTMSVAAPFVWRCLSGSAITPSPHPAHRTQQADFPHCALGQDLTPSPTPGRGRAGSDVRARSTRRGARVDSSRACVACPCA